MMDAIYDCPLLFLIYLFFFLLFLPILRNENTNLRMFGFQERRQSHHGGIEKETHMKISAIYKCCPMSTMVEYVVIVFGFIVVQ